MTDNFIIVLSLIVLVIAVTYLLCMFIVKCHRYLLINIVKSPNLERKNQMFHSSGLLWLCVHWLFYAPVLEELADSTCFDWPAMQLSQVKDCVEHLSIVCLLVWDNCDLRVFKTLRNTFIGTTKTVRMMDWSRDWKRSSAIEEVHL